MSGLLHKSNSCPPNFISNNGQLTPPPSNGSRRAGINGHNGAGVPMGDGSDNGRAIPGRPRRRVGNRGAPLKPKRKIANPTMTIKGRMFRAPSWMKNPMQDFSAYTSIFFAVVLWYTLGVVSITTSNLLMMEPKHYVGGVPPLYLTFQQLVIGTTLLRCLLRIRFLGSAGIQPWPSPSLAAAQAESNRRSNLLFNHKHLENKNKSWISDMVSSNLVLSGVFFAAGFLATNGGFLASSAAFVETIKAAEPITSAAIAVLWGIESLGGHEVVSLGSIVAGVLISTLAHTRSGAQASPDVPITSTLTQTIQSSCIVMASNLCFSFRGLYQKLFRASPEGNAQVVDDLNLQLRMQQVGVAILAIPVLVLNVPEMFSRVSTLNATVGLIKSGALFRYIGLALVNGIAFTSYNLASTYILSRISVVHHAALNCIRRIFAIIMTSLFFRIPITLMGVFGFAVSFGGFMAFTHFKVKKQRQPKPLSSLLPISAANNE